MKNLDSKLTEYFKSDNSSIDKLVMLLLFVSDAGSLLSEPIDIKLCELLNERIKEAHNLIETKGYDILYEALDQIEEGLATNTQSSHFQIRIILRKFIDVSPYLHIQVKKEYKEERRVVKGKEITENTIMIDDTTYSKACVETHLLLEHYCAWRKPTIDYRCASVPQKFILCCFRLFNIFFSKLDALCLDFDIDLDVIQKEINKKIFTRDEAGLRILGYDLDVIEKTNDAGSFLHQQGESNESPTMKIISEEFETLNLNKRGWEWAFKSESDYINFTNLLTNFFESKEYELPETIIQLKRGCKTKLGAILGKIHARLSNGGTLSGDTNYFKIVRTLSHFENEKDLYKVLTRRRRE